MVPRRDRVVLWTFTVVVLVWMVAQAFGGAETGLLYVAPALVLALPLVLGRYVGEEQLAVLAARAPRRAVRRPAPVSAPRSHAQVMQRGGRLVASSLAKRPPPGAEPLPAA